MGSRVIWLHLGMVLFVAGSSARIRGQELDIPEPLQAWKPWAIWGAPHIDCPRPFNASGEAICFWPQRLELSAQSTGAEWRIRVRAFETTWVPLPGDAAQWPRDVRANGAPVAVTERDGGPVVRLPAGEHQLQGNFQWAEMPQRLKIPGEVGILALTVDGGEVTLPNWDPNGDVWLQRAATPAAEKDQLTVQVYRRLDDGIPQWLRTRVQLTVSGKSREEQLGELLPSGWQLSFAESPIPVAVDEQGRLRVQVRAGTWTVSIDAFRNAPEAAVAFAPTAQPLAAQELIGFHSDPTFRIAELEGGTPIDASLSTFPDDWRALPVYEWTTNAELRVVEKLRGSGLQRPEGLTITRHFWLDDDGWGLTYQDSISGRAQRTWRLDVPPGNELGVVRIDGERQLITANPATQQRGVEIRQRDVRLEAIGRTGVGSPLRATGWQTDAETLQLTWSLPPGWRMFALFGADRVAGDWLTTWSLLDLFLLLIFALAVARLWGWWAGLVALLAFGLAYHEPGAPRLTWLLMLMPIALLRLSGEGRIRRWLIAWRFLAAAILLLNLLPFAARQIQNGLYPQLESDGAYRPRSGWVWREMRAPLRESQVVGMGWNELPEQTIPNALPQEGKQAQSKFNLAFAPKTQIQTGPAQPTWSGNEVTCYWSGPVDQQQQIWPLLISRPLHQVLTGVRLLLLVMLSAIVFNFRPSGVRRRGRPGNAVAVAVVGLLVAAGISPSASGQIPDAATLDQLRERLLKAPDAFPRAADIAAVRVQLRDGRIEMQAEIHAAVDGVAVPLPGRLPGWSPVSVAVDQQPHALVCRRDDGYLWVLVPAGVHVVEATGWIGETSEWDWTYVLPPRHVVVDAPDWTVNGLRPDGVPEGQLLFSKRELPVGGGTSYDQRNFRGILAVQRRIEVGLEWKVQTTVERISAPGKAISAVIPLLPRERVLSSEATVEGDGIRVNLGAAQTAVSWESELDPVESLSLQAALATDWVERWSLVMSPVWHVESSGLEPVFETVSAELIPVWRPWPGEGVQLQFHRPDAVSGETTTVQSVGHEVQLGARQQTTTLRIAVESSLGSEFPIRFPADRDVTALRVDGQATPVRRDQAAVIVPLGPGLSQIELIWTSAVPLRTRYAMEPVGLPVDAANVGTSLVVPENRWVLWAEGPLRGPAVRFWIILAASLLLAVVLGSLSLSPLGRGEWMLLAIGLTQVPIPAALIVVSWLFLLAWRKQLDPQRASVWGFNLLQVLLVLLTIGVLGIFIAVVGEGLLGDPEMFIVGNGSYRNNLQWFLPRSGTELPQPWILTISVWYYRLLMLLWALWLAWSLLRWLRLGWVAFTSGGGWRRRRTIETSGANPHSGAIVS